MCCLELLCHNCVLTMLCSGCGGGADHDGCIGSQLSTCTTLGAGGQEHPGELCSFKVVHVCPVQFVMHVSYVGTTMFVRIRRRSRYSSRTCLISCSHLQWRCGSPLVSFLTARCVCALSILTARCVCALSILPTLRRCLDFDLRFLGR